MSRPVCTCGGGICQRRDDIGRFAVRTYRCAGCHRKLPWCFGAHDEMPDHCDDCWADAQRQKEAA